MSIAEIANTTCTVFRGTTTDEYGDEQDDNTPLYQGVPCFLAETGKTVQDPSTATPRTIRDVTAQVPAWIGILNTDRLMDESTGNVYIILSVTRPPTIIGVPVDPVLSLKRITAASS